MKKQLKTEALQYQFVIQVALLGLGKLGIAVKWIYFNEARLQPVIIVTSANTDKLKGTVVGGGIARRSGRQYLQFGVVYRGCQIQWRQYLKAIEVAK